MFRIKITSNNYNPELAFVPHVYEEEFDTIEDAYRHAMRFAQQRCNLYNSRLHRAFFEVVANNDSIMAKYDFVHPHSILIIARDRKKIEKGVPSGTLSSCLDVVDKNGNICDVAPYVSRGNES